MSLACIRGCARLRRHASDCDHPNTCPGCQPRLAEHGRLCWPCHRRLQQMLTEAPMVHDWLSANLAATGGAQVREDYERSARVVGSPAPLRPDVLDARQAISDTLTEYVDDLCQRHDLRGPDHHTVQADSAYLLTWLDRIEAFEWVGDWWEHLAQLMTDAHALAPWRPEMRRCHGIPCPECGRTTLVIFGGDEDVTCLSCRTLVPPDRYAIWTRIAADEWSEGA